MVAGDVAVAVAAVVGTVAGGRSAVVAHTEPIGVVDVRSGQAVFVVVGVGKTLVGAAQRAVVVFPIADVAIVEHVVAADIGIVVVTVVGTVALARGPVVARADAVGVVDIGPGEAVLVVVDVGEALVDVAQRAVVVLSVAHISVVEDVIARDVGVAVVAVVGTIAKGRGAIVSGARAIGIIDIGTGEPIFVVVDVGEALVDATQGAVVVLSVADVSVVEDVIARDVGIGVVAVVCAIALSGGAVHE